MSELIPAGGIPTARYQDVMAILLHNNLWEDLTTNQFFCLYSFRLEQSQKKDYNRRTTESVIFLKEVTLESLWVPRLFISERKMKQIQFYIPPNPSQNSGWTEVLAQHYAFTEVGKEHATRTRGWFHVCTITHRTSQNFFQVRNTYQILQPPSRINEIAQTWFIKNLDNSI